MSSWHLASGGFGRVSALQAARGSTSAFVLDSAVDTVFELTLEGSEWKRTAFRRPSHMASDLAVDSDDTVLLCEPRLGCVSRIERDGHRTVVAPVWRSATMIGWSIDVAPNGVAWLAGTSVAAGDDTGWGVWTMDVSSAQHVDPEPLPIPGAVRGPASIAAGSRDGCLAYCLDGSARLVAIEDHQGNRRQLLDGLPKALTAPATVPARVSVDPSGQPWVCASGGLFTTPDNEAERARVAAGLPDDAVAITWLTTEAGVRPMVATRDAVYVFSDQSLAARQGETDD